MSQGLAKKKLNILFVCERGHPPLDYLRAFAQRGHNFRIYTDTDRAMQEFNRKPFAFDYVLLDVPPEEMPENDIA